MDPKIFMHTAALVKSVSWYAKMKTNFDDVSFENFKINKEKDYSALVAYDKEFSLKTVRRYVEYYLVQAEKEGKIGQIEKSLIKNHFNIQCLHDSDVLTRLYDQIFNKCESEEGKISNLSSITNCIDVLTGQEDDIEEWFNKFDRVAIANGWSDFEKGRKVPVWFKEKPLNIWSELSEDAKYDYAAVKENIISKLDRANDITYLQDFFNRVQKTGESVDDYAIALKKAFNKAFRGSKSEDAQRTLLGRFRTGLIPEVQSLMCTIEPKKIDEAIDLANKVEKTLELQLKRLSINSVQATEHNKQSTHKSRRFERSRSRKRSITPLRRNRDRSKSSSQSPIRLICYNCHKQGHMAKDCHLKNKSTFSFQKKTAFNKKKDLNY